ncbi:TPA: DNA cytosine methyltransferase [Burkholderia cepacia]
MLGINTTQRTYNVFTMCSGLGGGAKGFQRAMSRVGNMTATWRCIGGIDNDAAACRDFKSLVGVECTNRDLFTREQYTAFNGAEPPAGWREVTPADVRAAAGNEHPHCVFISSPCKGASGLLSEQLSRTPKYQALNELTLRCVWLMCEAWKDDPVELIVFENVPRLMTRARHLLDQIVQILRHYGYAVNETTHDCGMIAKRGMAQSRKRFLLVARHAEKVPAFLYEPEMHRLQGVGTLLGRMPLPGDDTAGPMHRVPSLQWKTWVRLAFVEAGSDWRSLDRLAVQDGYLRDYAIVPAMHDTPLSVDDMRAPEGAAQYQQYGVLKWGDPSGAIIGVKSPGQGTFAVADPRHTGTPKHNNEFRIVRWEEAAGTVTSAHGTGQCVQDPRPGWPESAHGSKLKVTDFNEPAGTVTGARFGSGGLAVADPRPGFRREKGDNYLTGGHYGVVGWDQFSGAVSAAAGHDNGRWSVADPRVPQARDKMTAIIRSIDGTWHRPFTTLELAVLQSLVEPEEQLVLDGLSDQAWRERIGNAVPPDAAEAVGEVMGTTLLLAEAGETFMLSATPIWVRPVALALTLPAAY